MKLSDLAPATRRRIGQMRFDRIVEKHEGPWRWQYRIDEERVEFLTLFLTDTTFFTGMDAGFLAVCEKVPGEDWYLALVYHEWFVMDDVPAQYRSA